MTRPVPMEPPPETVVSFMERSTDVGKDEPQDSTKHEPKQCSLFKGMNPRVARAPRKELVSESCLSQGCHHECGQCATADRVSKTSSTQNCHRECDPGLAESVNWSAANHSDGVRIQMTAEVETEWLDDVGVTEWLDDVGVVSYSVQKDASVSHCAPQHPQADAVGCMSSASQQHNLDAEANAGSETMDPGISISSSESEFTECVYGSKPWAASIRVRYVVTVTCAAMADCCVMAFFEATE